jgi:hypothetical protein
MWPQAALAACTEALAQHVAKIEGYPHVRLGARFGKRYYSCRRLPVSDSDVVVDVSLSGTD